MDQRSVNHEIMAIVTKITFRHPVIDIPSIQWKLFLDQDVVAVSV